MRHSFRVVLGLCLALSAGGCSDYLSGPNVTTNPNAPATLTAPGPLYVGIQAAMPAQREGQTARDAVMYTQQVAGIDRQHRGYDQYNTTGGDMDAYFGAVYSTGSGTNVLTGGGGLLDIRKAEQFARVAKDTLFLGILKVYEALEIGYAADIWGDIPYRQAADSTILQPAFDPQLQIYTDLQSQLDSAITFLAASGPSNVGPLAGGTELVYKGATDPINLIYTEVAHSLKARYYMHTAAKNGAGDYTKALAEVSLGISTPAHDFLWYHDATTFGNNFWFQFEVINRTGDIGPGAAVIEILKRRIKAGVEDSSRLKFYFTDDGAGDYHGYRPGAATVTTSGGIYDGSGPYSSFGSVIDLSDGSFRQPELTYAETQLIGAEAALQTGNAALAQADLDNARKQRQYGMLDGVPVTFPDLPSVPATLQNILEEKYVTLYLNPEVWNDYKRTCLPSLAPAPAPGSSTPGSAAPGYIPGRLPYGQTEVNANPNVPKVSSAGVTITATSINPNQPASCQALNYATSVPLAN